MSAENEVIYDGRIYMPYTKKRVNLFRLLV